MTDNFDRALQERLLARSQVSTREIEALRLFARTLPARRSLWRGRAMQWALGAAAVVLAAVVAIPVITRGPGFGSTPSPTPVPTAPATPAPSVPTPTTAPAPTPSAPINTPLPSIGIGLIRLAVASGSVVNVAIDDPDGLLTGAVAEQANDGMSFAWSNSKVEAVGPNSIRVTWVGYPRDEEVQLEVSESESGGLLLHFIQAQPLPNTDGEGEDRVILLRFSDPIDPSDVEVTFERA
jgi:hypothetical protein